MKCTAEVRELERFTGSSRFLSPLSNSVFANPWAMAPAPAQAAIAAALCCACKSGAFTYEDFYTSALVQTFMNYSVDCTATPPTLAALDGQALGKCSAVQNVPLSSVIRGCLNPPAGKSPSPWQKAKVPVIIILSLLGVGIVAGIAVLAVLKMKGGSGGAKPKKAPAPKTEAPKPDPATPDPAKP